MRLLNLPLFVAIKRYFRWSDEVVVDMSIAKSSTFVLSCICIFSLSTQRLVCSLCMGLRLSTCAAKVQNQVYQDSVDQTSPSGIDIC